MPGQADSACWDRNGFMLLRGLVPAPVCASMRAALWRALRDVHGMRPDAPETWHTALPRGLNRRFTTADAAGIACPALIGHIDALLGANTWAHPRTWAQPLPVFPTRDRWDVPSRMWHLDYPVRGSAEPLFAVKMLCLLTDLEPRGGGTLLLAGSHRLLERCAANGAGGNSGHIRKRLCARHPWLRELMSTPVPEVDRVQRFMIEGAVVDGAFLKVVEVTGGPGDVVLFHPWLFHNISPNCRSTPRMMVGQNFTTRDGLRIYAREGNTPVAAIS